MLKSIYCRSKYHLEKFFGLLVPILLYSSVAMASENMQLNSGEHIVTNEVTHEIEFIPGEAIVGFKEQPLITRSLSTLQKTHVYSDLMAQKLGRRTYLLSSQQVQAKKQALTKEREEEHDMSTLMFIETLKRDPAIEFVEPNYIVKASFVPDDPFFQDQWGANNTGQSGGAPDADIDMPESWDVIGGGNTVHIAVLDTGVDVTHPDLANQILRDGNNNVVGYDFVNNDADPSDDNGHGTHCAGVIAAQLNNAAGIAGICENCKILPVKFLNSEGSGTTADAIASIQFAIDHGAHVISNSWGGYGYSQGLQAVISDAYNQGIVVVAAAGNDNIAMNHYPAALQYVVSVSATDHADIKASFSNYGSNIDLAAPGESILSTFPPGADLDGSHDTSCEDANHQGAFDGYGYCDGTSMAAPFVAGVAGIIKDYNPSFSAAEVIERLYVSAEDKGDIGWDQRFGYGRLNAHWAINPTSIPAKIHARIVSPIEEQWVGKRVRITGDAFGTSFSSYTVEFGSAVNPEVWRTQGISLTNKGFLPLIDDVLAEWDTTGLSDGVWTIRLTVFAGSGGSTSSQKSIEVHNTLESGFPVKTWHGAGSYHGGQAIHTLVADITGDTYQEILVTGLSTGPLYAFDYQGNLLPNWPVSSFNGSAAYPAAKETLVISGYYGGILKAYNAEGQAVWTRTAKNYIATPPSIGYLTTQNTDGVFLGEEDGELHGYDLEDGNILYGWPGQAGHSQKMQTPAIADFDDDGEVEIISGSGWLTSGIKIYAFNEDGSLYWDTHFTNGETHTFPVIGDVDNDGRLEIIVITTADSFPWNNIVNVLDTRGNVKKSWLLTGDMGYGTAPALADITGDDVPETIVQTNGYLEVFDGFGQPVSGWPLAIPLASYYVNIGNSAPVIGDVDGDPTQEIVFITNGSNRGYVHVVNHDGTYVSGYPMRMPIGNGAVPAIADIDNDSHNEIIITGSYWNGYSGYYDKVWLFDLDRDNPGAIHGGIEWGQFGGNAQHTNTYIKNLTHACGGTDEILDYTIQGGEEVNCRATNSIRLLPGFHAEEGSVFRGYIE